MSSATKNWTFDSNAESWTNSTATASATYISATGDPSSGCLQMSVNNSRAGGSVYWQYRGNYAGIFGISTAAAINSIGGAAGDDFHWKLSSMTGSSGIRLGAVELRTSANATIAPFSAQTTISTVVSAWTTRALELVNVSTRGHFGQTSVIIRCNYSASMGNVAGAVAEMLIDSFTLTVDYSLVTTHELTNASASHPHTIAAIVQYQTQNLTDGSLTHSHTEDAAPWYQTHVLDL